MLLTTISERLPVEELHDDARRPCTFTCIYQHWYYQPTYIIYSMHNHNSSPTQGTKGHTIAKTVLDVCYSATTAQCWHNKESKLTDRCLRVRLEVRHTGHGWQVWQSHSWTDFSKQSAARLIHFVCPKNKTRETKIVVTPRIFFCPTTNRLIGKSFKWRFLRGCSRKLSILLMTFNRNKSSLLRPFRITTIS